MRPREVKCLAQGHMASLRPRWDSNPLLQVLGCQALCPVFLVRLGAFDARRGVASVPETSLPIQKHPDTTLYTPWSRFRQDVGNTPPSPPRPGLMCDSAFSYGCIPAAPFTVPGTAWMAQEGDTQCWLFAQHSFRFLCSDIDMPSPK